MKTVGQKNTMLILVGRDGNNNNIVMTVGLVPFENTSDCQWFLLHCMKAGIEMTDVPFFMDRGKAGIAAGSTLGLQLHFCTRHISGNVKRNFKGRLTAD
ncbi:hypothetical protein PF005_g29806 [Phytophthora fragariae]|uniref:MULE transposase domain-containing protein n=1 Tax=Phytophthora fragariae TaxID=53985 RepID=A0A6A4B6U8_9STRA|nr:hypothetical protein PF003_g15284 [Phytophthora fragariae]KAE8919543.1 hypothetical protein PF009_g30151 [Phytophthora fragariae]KAE9063255.1 hypothetical protein PF007_g29611 [Phytophthora fragariae]KAE9069692.1 hypothetical protein PF006_g29520 [Phytophthora fragariae]KAE9164965.1 hypothetical protein PF005_g29806 [Phytophthora fragariae]